MHTVQEIINRLPAWDCRKDFWRQIQELIRDQQYGLVLEKIAAHNADVDYPEQVNIVTKEIAVRMLKNWQQ